MNNDWTLDESVEKVDENASIQQNSQQQKIQFQQFKNATYLLTDGTKITPFDETHFYYNEQYLIFKPIDETMLVNDEDLHLHDNENVIIKEDTVDLATVANEKLPPFQTLKYNDTALFNKKALFAYAKWNFFFSILAFALFFYLIVIIALTILEIVGQNILILVTNINDNWIAFFVLAVVWASFLLFFLLRTDEKVKATDKEDDEIFKIYQKNKWKMFVPIVNYSASKQLIQSLGAAISNQTNNIAIQTKLNLINYDRLDMLK